ncbi:Predicted Zn-dependent peptidase [Alteribacillus persepolensis]|uniref:Predicted Zn-dependent peptidase n=1 Tax=Alteribacillus persepolensis TaxID=568899 RepID=A0A1G7YTK2_9BACI|nr:pitrilysin family protein [Alteribacillus persepolensis]SDG99529.1 Predicted Zn-dependent peptidase [Alteribacillus persepolensis]
MVETLTLNNGLRVVTEHISSVRSVTMGIWVKAGSRYEQQQENGISHFLEHMFFKGTNSQSAADIAESFDKIGGQVNALTSKEYTCFYAKVLDEHAQRALDILADMFFHATFDSDELEKERNVIFEEIKMVDDTPDDIVHDILSEASYGDHPLGKPILGTEHTVSQFTKEQLQSYKSRFYTAENVVISLAGNIHDALLRQIEKKFGSFANQHHAQPVTAPTFQTGKKTKKKDTEQAHLCLGFPGLQTGDDNIYALILLNNVLGGSMSSRLFQDIRENKGLAYSVFSYHSAFQDNGMLTIYGGTGYHQLDELYESIMHCVTDLQENGLTEKELANGKEQLKGNLMLSLESTSSRMSRNGKNELLLGRHRSLDELIERVQAVDLNDIKTTANQVFQGDFALSLISKDGKLPGSVN